MKTAKVTFIVGRPWGAAQWLVWSAVLATAVAAFAWSAQDVEMSVSELAKGLPWMADFVGRMLPPNWSFMPRLVRPVLETIQLAVWGTLFSIVLALPLCFFAARNLTPSLLLYHAARQTFNVIRGVNELIFALIFVAAVGLGPFAGVLALSVHGAGMLGKFFAEAI